MTSRLLLRLFNPSSSFTLLLRRHNHSKNPLIPVKLCQGFSSAALHENNLVSSHRTLPSHPWPEWCQFIDMIFVKGHYKCDWLDGLFVAEENLPKDFVNVSKLCVDFGLDHSYGMIRWLSRNDMEVLTNDVYPSLFKSAHDNDRRMRYFFQGYHPLGQRRASTDDLMKYILTFLSTPIVYPEKSIKEATESSVRSLLYQMANLALNGFSYGLKIPGPDGTPRRQWICPKCSFMNFARNTKCLECDETRPQRHLPGEWDCPRCKFFNKRKNTVCLKCEFKPPYEVSLTYPSSTETQEKYEEDYTYKWFKKVMEVYDVLVTRPTIR